MIEGQDWASYQPPTPDAAGIAFTFIKATEGTGYVSQRMASQTAHARQAGLVVGFYHYLKPGDMTAQAAYFVAKAASGDGDILAADWEDPGVSCAQKDQFIREVKRLRPGHKVVLYCNSSFWKGRDTTSYTGDGLWIADPNHPEGHPGVQADWLFQQYSSAGGVDRNVANPRHFKTVADLRAWASGSAPAPTPITPQEGPMNKADIELIASTDGVFPAPRDASDYSADPKNSGHYWSLNSHMLAQTEGIRAVAKTVAGLEAPALTDAQVATIAAAVAAAPGLADAIASKVAEQLAARLAN